MQRGSRPCQRSQAGPSGRHVARSGPTGTYSGEWDKLSVEEIDEWQDRGPKTPLLDTVNFPVHMKNFNVDQLKQLCKEVRSDIVHTVSRTGGHLSSSLGVVELTVALHYVFNTPEDKIIWDVGHQAYGHKILTGRRKGMASIRTTNGLSGGTPGTGSWSACVAQFGAVGFGPRSRRSGSQVQQALGNA